MLISRGSNCTKVLFMPVALLIHSFFFLSLKLYIAHELQLQSIS